MSGKVKMRCARCSKSFKSVSAKQTLCLECEAKERAARAAGKLVSNKPVVAPAKAQPPTIVGPGAGILVPGLATVTAATSAEVHHPTVVQPAQPQHKQQPQQQAPEHAQPTAYPAQNARDAHTPRHKDDHLYAPAATHPHKMLKRARQPKAPREQTPSYVLTDEMRARIEVRYQELAQPVEFDGIRTQIAAELDVPKQAVKRTVAELRQRLQLPSWWELQSYTGSAAELTSIRAAYLPHLPVPAVGIHKQLAEELHLDSGIVYQGIRRIRAEMRLPQYNPPETHTTITPTSASDAVAASSAEKAEEAEAS